MPIFTTGPGIVYTLPGSNVFLVSLPLYNFTSFTFTNMGATGSNGPISITYGSSTPGFNTPYVLTLSGGIQRWTVPQTRSYQIISAGAGASSGSIFAYGVVVSTTIRLTQGDIIYILCGQSGGLSGSGGTFVYNYSTGLLNDNTNGLILVAGGGGGCGGQNGTQTATVNTNGNTVVGSSFPAANGGTNGSGGEGNQNTGQSGAPGGGGFLLNRLVTNYLPGGGLGGLGAGLTSTSGGSGFLSGGTGGSGSPNGGFGGGGANRFGGGGGYSGGGGGRTASTGLCGGGGGSYNVNGINKNATLYTGTLPAGVSGQVSGGYNLGNGFVVINAV
jgi:hypothetical protein